MPEIFYSSLYSFFSFEIYGRALDWPGSFYDSFSNFRDELYIVFCSKFTNGVWC
jgi:hypothetical protein